MHPLLLESVPSPDDTTRPEAPSWAQFVDANPNPSWGSDAAGRLLRANPSWAELIGLETSPSPPPAVDLGALIHPDDISCLRAQSTMDQAVMHYEYRLRTARGNFRWIRESVSPVREADGKLSGYLGCAQDITTEKETTERRSEIQQAEALGRMVGRVVHDCNNQITAARMFADILRTTVTAPEDRDLLDQISHSCSSAEFLLKKLTGLSQEEVAQPERLDLNLVVKNLRGFIGSLIDDYVELEVLVESTPGWVEINRKQVEEVCFNLCVNARNALLDGGKLTIQVDTITAASAPSPDLGPGTYLRLTVADTGTGISPSDLPRVFDPFFTTKPKNKGIGLGLATCRRIAREAKGDILIESEPGHGTRVLLWLPVAP